MSKENEVFRMSNDECTPISEWPPPEDDDIHEKEVNSSPSFLANNISALGGEVQAKIS